MWFYQMLNVERIGKKSLNRNWNQSKNLNNETANNDTWTNNRF
jgi:hypothetical protein